MMINTKIEAPHPKQIEIPIFKIKNKHFDNLSFGHLDLFRISTFGFRI